MADSRLLGWGRTLAVTGLLLGLPLLAGYGFAGSRVLFSLLASDSMYYMGVAHHYLTGGFMGIGADASSATNGFHPLWQWLLIVLFKITGASHHNEIWVVFFASLLLVWAAYALLSLSLQKLLGIYPGLLATLALFPGAYGVLVEPRRHSSGEPGVLYTLSPLSAVNGMETALSLLFWALFFVKFVPKFYAAAKPTDLREFFPLSVRLLLAAIVLTRLDDIFLLVAIALFIIRQDYPYRDLARTLVHAFWPAALALLIYMGINEASVGAALPVSATAKMASLSGKNLSWLLGTWVGNSGDVWWIGAVRVFPLAFSLLFGIALLRRSWRERILHPAHNPLMALLYTGGWFLVLKATFLFVSVPMIMQGYWYYFSMIGVANVVCAVTVAQFAYRTNVQRMAWYALLAVIVFRMPNDIAFLGREGDDYDRTSYELWQHGDEIRDYLGSKAPGAKLVDTLDGMYAYLLDMPAESYTGLVSSPAEIARRKKIGLWESVISQGYTLVPEYGYIDPTATPRPFEIIDAIKPPSSPVAFYRVKTEK